MEPTDLTIEVLRSIRDEARLSRDHLGQAIESSGTRLGARIDETNACLDETNRRLEQIDQGRVEAEVRVATHLVALVSAVHEVRDVLREELGVRKQVDDHERRLRAIESRGG
jgi:hypothetical protein